MKKKISKSLVLGKRSIAILSNDSMIKIEGGATGSGYTCVNPPPATSGCSSNCANTSSCGGGGGYGNLTITSKGCGSSLSGGASCMPGMGC